MREVLEYQIGEGELGFLGFTTELPQISDQPEARLESAQSGKGKKLWIQRRPVAGFSQAQLSAVDEASNKLQQTHNFDAARIILQQAGIEVNYKKTP